MLKQFLAFGVLTAVSGCTINIKTEGSHEGLDHHEWHEEKEEWHASGDLAARNERRGRRRRGRRRRRGHGGRGA